MIDWKNLPLEQWSNREIIHGGDEWPEFPNVHQYPYNTDDPTKPYCWDYSQDLVGTRFAHLMTIEDWMDCCNCGGFIDYDGYGALLEFRDGDYYPLNVEMWPSKRNQMPANATHIDWFNK